MPNKRGTVKRTTDRRVKSNQDLVPHKGGVPLPQPAQPPSKPPGNKPATTGTER